MILDLVFGPSLRLMVQSQSAGIFFLPYLVEDGTNVAQFLKTMPKIYLLGSASREEQAGAIGSEANLSRDDRMEKRTNFPQYIGVNATPGTAILLDGVRFKNVIFINSQIRYDGETPPVLENVVFVNCVFAIKQNAQTMRFAAAVMSPGPTHFQG